MGWFRLVTWDEGGAIVVHVRRLSITGHNSVRVRRDCWFVGREPVGRRLGVSHHLPVRRAMGGDVRVPTAAWPMKDEQPVLVGNPGHTRELNDLTHIRKRVHLLAQTSDSIGS